MPHFECGAFNHSATSPGGCDRGQGGPSQSSRLLSKRERRNKRGAKPCSARPFTAAIASRGGGLVIESRPMCRIRISLLGAEGEASRDTDALALLANPNEAQLSILRHRPQESGAGSRCWEPKSPTSTPTSLTAARMRLPHRGSAARMASLGSIRPAHVHR
jgi:hypothetical protein